VNQLLSYQTAANLLGCSRAPVNDLALAAERAAEIRAGARKIEDVPPRLRLTPRPIPAHLLAP